MLTAVDKPLLLADRTCVAVELIVRWTSIVIVRLSVVCNGCIVVKRYILEKTLHSRE